VDQISQVIEAESGSQLFGGLGVEEQAEVWGMLGRLQGDDAWSNADIRTVINGESSNVAHRSLAQHGIILK
jgi:hypothetical protein